MQMSKSECHLQRPFYVRQPLYRGENKQFYVCMLDASPINKRLFSYAWLQASFSFENEQRENEIKGLHCFLANFTVSFLICVWM